MTLIFSGIFGLLIGSFLNVCIYRVPRKLSVVSPCRSYCPACSSTLSWWENIPVFSWLFLLAKCRHCRCSISGGYPLVELLSSLAAIASVIKFGPTLTALIVYALVAALIVITFVDLAFKIIPNVISFPGMTLGLLLGIFSQFTGMLHFPLTQSTGDSLLGFLAGGGFFYALSAGYYAVTKRVGLGGGDVKLLAMTGAILGLGSVLPTIFVGSFLGAIVGIASMLIMRRGRHSEIPFGPWLSLGAILYIFGELPFFRF